MVLSLCPATVRAQTVSEKFSAKVAEAAETEEEQSEASGDSWHEIVTDFSD